MNFSSDGMLSSFERKSVIVTDAGSPVAGATFFDPDGDPQTDADPSEGYTPDPGMLDLVNDLLAPLNLFVNSPVGTVRRTLDDSVDGVRRIRVQEMPLGNVACDAMLDNVNKNSPGIGQICMQNAGGIRAPIEAGEVTFGDVITVFPFSNVVSILKMDGARIHAAVEHGLGRVGEDRGEFLHFGKGFELVYNPANDPFSRVESIKLNGVDILNDTSQEFNVVTNSFIAAGGDGYGDIMTGAEVVLASGEPQEDAVAEYIRDNPKLCQELEGRIIPLSNPVDTIGNEIDVLGNAFLTCSVQFTVLHINDMHARVEGMRGTGGCNQAQNDVSECDGGWARMLAAAKRLVAKADNPVIFVDNGDQFAGTPWSTFYQGFETFTFKNKFCDDAGFFACVSGIGNHEFDFGYEVLLNYARNLNHDLISSNVDDACPENSNGNHSEGELGSLLKKNKIITIEDFTIGFVGYVTPETPLISSPPDCMNFTSEEDAMKQQVETLKAAEVDIVIAVGHSGVNIDLDISAKIPELDLIIGGHTHTFLWNEEEQGPVPAQSRPRRDDNDEVSGVRTDGVVDVYPVFAENSTTPVVQAFFGSRYMGGLAMTFNQQGLLESFDRKSVIVADAGSSVAGATFFTPGADPETDANASKAFVPDPDMLALVNDLLEPLNEFINSPVGTVLRTLDDSVDGLRRIRMQEMPLGNVVCDSMLDNVNKISAGIGDICMQNSGGIRAPIEAGEVTFGDVITVLPFANVISILRMDGARIHAAIEHGLARVGQDRGEFLHFSEGFELVYDPLLEANSRVINITLNGVPITKDQSQEFNIVTNSFLAAGGDGYGEIMTEAEVILALGEPQEDALAEYIQDNPDLCQETEDRIVPLNNPVDEFNNEIDVLGTVFAPCSGVVNFTILHINDMHARVEGMRGTGGCNEAQNNVSECDGGWARMLTAGKRFVEEAGHPVIFVDNGDQFAGTPWSTFYQGEETYTFKNKFCEDAGFLLCLSGIGNHEFDFGYEPMLEYARNLNHDLINSNVDDACPAGSNGDHSEGELGTFLKKSKIATVGGLNVGFIGYVTTETPLISSPPDCMTFVDEEESMRAQVADLKANGVDLVIAIGHSGIDKDLDLAAKIPEIDLIIGGHSHTFLWNEEEQGPVPAQVQFFLIASIIFLNLSL